MATMFYYLKNIRWLLFLKRCIALILESFILFIPVWILSFILFSCEAKLGFLDFFEPDLGLWLISYGWYTFFWWISSVLLFQEKIIDVVMMALIIVPIYFSFFIYNSFVVSIVSNDIGGLLSKLIIVDKCGKRAARWRIVIRTFLKYLTVFLCPILLLLPLFNRRQACLHELLSGAYKVEKTVTYYPPVQTQEQ